MTDITDPNVTDPPTAPTGEPSSTPPDDAPAEAPPGDAKWYDSFSDDLKGNDRITSFESPEAMAKAYLENPEPPSIPEAGDYKLPENLPKQFGEFANKTGLTQEQVDHILKFNSEQMAAQSHAYERMQSQKMQELLTEWGDEADSNVNLAKQVLQQFDTEDRQMAEYLRTAKAGNNPIVIQFLATLGQMLKEGEFLKSETVSPTNVVSPADRLYPKQASGE